MILKAFALGLSTGLFCIGYCYPILAPLMFSRKEPRFGRTASSVGLFLAGRLAAYLLFGAATGLIGRFAGGIRIVQAVVVPALFLLLGAALVFYGLFPRLPQWGICRVAGRCLEDRRFLLWAGFVAGLSLCPPFLLALSYALSLASVARSVAFFCVFFLATSLYLLPFLFSGLAARFALVRQAARTAAVVAGVWFAALAFHAAASGRM